MGVPQIHTVRTAGSNAVASSSVRRPSIINIPFVVVVILLVGYGLAIVYSAVSVDEDYSFTRQLAGVGVGIFKDYADVSSMISVRSTHPVNPQWQAAYQEIYAIYADIYDRIRPLNNRIAGLNYDH